MLIHFENDFYKIQNKKKQLIEQVLNIVIKKYGGLFRYNKNNLNLLLKLQNSFNFFFLWIINLSSNI